MAVLCKYCALQPLVAHRPIHCSTTSRHVRRISASNGEELPGLLSCQRRKDQTNALQKQVGAAHDDHKYGNVDGTSERWTWETISPRIGHVKRSYSVV